MLPKNDDSRVTSVQHRTGILHRESSEVKNRRKTENEKPYPKMDEMLLGPSVAAGSSAGCRSVVEYFIVARCWRNGFFTCLFIEVSAKRRTVPSPFPLGNGWSFGWTVPRRDSKLCTVVSGKCLPVDIPFRLSRETALLCCSKSLLLVTGRCAVWASYVPR